VQSARLSSSSAARTRDPAVEKELGGKLKDELLAAAAKLSADLGYVAPQRIRKS
jgi:hypothetical protein